MGKKIITLIPAVLAGLSVLMLTAGIFTQKVSAQDFYGEGNVLIAVDMGTYAENEDVYYREGSMGTLIWGDDAPTGVSTRAPFNNYSHTVPEDVTTVKCPEYEIETVYHVGQRFFIPVFPGGLSDKLERKWVPADSFPSEVFENGKESLLYNPEYIKYEGRDELYYIYAVETPEGEYVPFGQFVEIECSGISEYTTVWRYTGVRYSADPYVDTSAFEKEVIISPDEIRQILEEADESYLRESQTYADPHFEDYMGDRDGKTAYLIIDTDPFFPGQIAMFYFDYTSFCCFDCMLMNSLFLNDDPSIMGQLLYTLCHELNHYILFGYYVFDNIEVCLAELFAESAVCINKDYYIENMKILTDAHLTDKSSRLRMIPGILWEDYVNKYPNYNSMIYSAGTFFLQYIDKLTTGNTDGRLWTEYFAEQTPEKGFTLKSLDEFLNRITGDSLKDWVARFMADLVTESEEAWSGTVPGMILPESGIDMNVFLRPCQDYGNTSGSVDEAADEMIKEYFKYYFNQTAIRGGGTTYAYRNDAGGRIAITGADDNWYFFAVNMELPDPDRVIEISTAEELAGIGNDPDYPLSGNYILTADIDLGGKDSIQTPVGKSNPFTGTFDGNGHSITGLYINTPGNNNTGLFAQICGNAEIRNLTVEGYVKGNNCVGGIAGYIYYGSVINCTSKVTVFGNNFCGGIAGYNNSGIISECTARGSVTRRLNTGGITGGGNNNTLICCHNKIPGIDLSGPSSGNSCLVDKAGRAKLFSIYEHQEELVIPDHLTVSEESWPIAYIRKGTLQNRKELKSVTIGENVVAIGKDAFRGDSNLKDIVLTASVIRIRKNAFKGIAKDAVFKITASESDFKRMVELLQKSGVSKTVTFERIEPSL